MNSESSSVSTGKVEPESWREDTLLPTGEVSRCPPVPLVSGEIMARDEARLFDLLGRIDHKILGGDCIYIELKGSSYKVLYCGYWRSIYTGVAHYLLRCKEIKEGMWRQGAAAATEVDLSVHYSQHGWVIEGQPLRSLLYREFSIF